MMTVEDAELRVDVLTDALAGYPETVEVVARAIRAAYALSVNAPTDDLAGGVSDWRGEAIAALAALREHLTPSLPNEGNDNG